MKRITLFLFLVHSIIHAQEPPAKLQFPYLGHPVAEFKDSLLCKDASNHDKPYSPGVKCMSYLVTPSTAIYRYGKIEFGSLIVFPDSTGIIRSFSHFISFIKGTAGDKAEDNMAQLAGYFNSRLGMTPRISNVKSDYSHEQVCTWKKDGKKIELRLSTFKKRKKGQLETVLDLYIAEER